MLAHGFFPAPGALAGDVHYDGAETWIATGPGGAGFDLLTVTVHELGHALGLDHTSVPSSTMNPFYPTPSVPQADDRAGVRAIYRDHIWVASLYRDLLGRRFDDDGLDFWVRQRTGGAGFDALARGFCYSAEHSQSLAAGLYPWLLDRQPDPGGLADWTAQLAAGASHQSVIIGFLTSAEYNGRYPSNDAWVDSLYRKLLRRAPDPGGLQYWVNRLNANDARSVVADGFLRSEEFCRARAAENYRRFLRREPEEGGWLYWTQRLQNNLAHQDLDVGFLASEEFRNGAVQWW